MLVIAFGFRGACADYFSETIGEITWRYRKDNTGLGGAFRSYSDTLATSALAAFPAEYKNSAVSLTLPSMIGDMQVRNINYRAFYDTAAYMADKDPNYPWIKEIIIPEGIRYIATDAFEGCTGCERIVFPDSLWKVDDAALYFSTIKDMVFSQTVLDCNQIRFYKPTLENATSSAGVTSIPDRAFRECSVLTNLTFSTNLKSIGEQVVARCENLKNIAIPNSVTNIAWAAFAGCNLTEIALPYVGIRRGDKGGDRRGFWYIWGDKVSTLSSPSYYLWKEGSTSRLSPLSINWVVD